MDETMIQAQVSELMKRPYQKVIWGTAEEGYVGQVAEFPGCMTDGLTEQEALERLQEATEGWLAVRLELGLSIPEPKAEYEPDYSGRMLLRLPKSLHRQLAERAELEGVSINQMAVVILAAGLGSPHAEKAPQLASRRA